MNLFERVGGLASWRGLLIVYAVCYKIGLASTLTFAIAATIMVPSLALLQLTFIPFIFLIGFMLSLLFFLVFNVIYLIAWVADRI
jgi:hypothetical protein